MKFSFCVLRRQEQLKIEPCRKTTYPHCSDESSLRRYADTIATLSFSSSVAVSRDPPSKKGCAIVTVNDKVRKYSKKKIKKKNS